VPKLARRSELTPLGAAFFVRPSDEVARALLGCRLVSEIGGGWRMGEIVETEAYTGPEDEASHASARIGRTPRNEVMFGRPGLAYVYRSYGIHWCLNAVTGPNGFPAAVLIRALRPLEGIEEMRAVRPGRPDLELARGPGKLCAAMGVELSANGASLSDPPLWLAAGEPVEEVRVARGPRIGITRAADLPLRFWLRDCPWVSATRR
jgi:DNA-3-methyladenine glycosylase